MRKALTGLRSRDLLLRLTPFFIIAFIVPLAKFHIAVSHNIEISKVLLKTQWYDDYFSLVKVCLLYIAVILAAVVFLFTARDKNKLPEILHLLIPYAALVMLSMIFSKHRVSAFFGVVDQYEGGLTQLLYLCILFFTCCMIRKTSYMVIIIKAALAGSFIISVIGMLQFTGILEIDPPFAVSSTIGNSNYVGTYGVLVLPLSVMMVLLEKNRGKKLLYLLVSYGSVFFLLSGSLSRAGYIGAIALVPLTFVLLWSQIKAQFKWIIGLVLYSFLIIIIMNILSGGLLLEEIKSLNPFYDSNQEERVMFEDVKLSGTSAEIQTDKWVIKIEYNDGVFSFKNSRGDPVLYIQNSGTQEIKFISEPYTIIEGYLSYEEDLAWLMLIIDERDMEFVLKNGRLWVIGYNGKLTDIPPVETSGFEDKESFASGRGYIWSRTIPLIKKAVFLGFGPDTFIYEFPQNDIAGKLNYGAIQTIISKPHSWYLQIAFGSGVISLISLMIFFTRYFYITFRNALIQYFPGRLITEERHTALTGSNQYQDRTRVISACVLLSVTGYLVAGIFNDSSVAVSPIFWMLLGFGIRFNYFINKDRFVPIIK